MQKKKQDQQIIANPPKNDKQVAFENVWLAGDGKRNKFQDDSFASFDNPNPFNRTYRNIVKEPVVPVNITDSDDEIDFAAFENPDPFNSSHRDIQWPKEQKPLNSEQQNQFQATPEVLVENGIPIPPPAPTNLDWQLPIVQEPEMSEPSIAETSTLNDDVENFFDDVEDDPVAPEVPQRPQFGPLVVGRNKIDIYELLMNQNTRPEK